jgi:hypothetical protein
MTSRSNRENSVFFNPATRMSPEETHSLPRKDTVLRVKGTNNLSVLLSAIPILPKKLGSDIHLFDLKSLSFS